MHRFARLARLASLTAVAVLLTACTGDEGGGGSSAPAGGEEPDQLDIPGFEDYLGGKTDTGYVGTRAAELEATFSGKVRVARPDLDAAALEAVAQALRDDPRSWEHRDVTVQVTEQIKYARNALKAEKMDLNLEGGTPELDSVEVLDGALELTYRVTVESLVKFKELEEQGLTPADLVGQVVQPKLPLLPEGLFDRTGAACTRDSETGGTVDPADLGAHNLFYYFDATQTGCPLADADLVTGTYEVESSLDAPTVYPEYDRLAADGRVDMVAVFGQITHGELKDNDWGFLSYDSFRRGFTGRGFQTAQRFEDNKGERLERTYPGGLVVSVTMLTPVQFADHVPREEANAVFRQAIRDNEIIYYNGHAFYGSLNVLDDRAAYPDDTYQVVFMDACWSYAYYTKQIFRNRATDEDPDGYALVDVINNTEPGITGSERTAQVMYDNLFKGAAAVHAGSDATLYSWNNMIKYMNDHAEERAKWRTKYPDPEIYGASGVRDNRWHPGIDDDPGPDPDPAADRFESAEAVAIPDNDEAGAKSVIEGPTEGTLAKVGVEVSIEHTWIGDLTVTLTHGDRELVLHDGTGGSADDLDLRLETDHFAGLQAEGSWTLRVVDGASQDTGRIVSWAITL